MNSLLTITSYAKDTVTLLLFACILVATTSVRAQKPHANVKGIWKMSVETSVGSGSPTFDLKHATDSTLTGTYKGQLGSAEVKGKVKGKTIHLEFAISGSLVEYDGTVNGDAMKGNVKLGSMGSGTFTGAKSK
jgi:hypothetical protein